MSVEYLAAAEDAFAYLIVNDASLLNDGEENILDDFDDRVVQGRAGLPGPERRYWP